MVITSSLSRHRGLGWHKNQCCGVNVLAAAHKHAFVREGDRLDSE
jgi:hypothetical protein